MNCAIPSVSRRRLFWVTQPDACGSQASCGNECGVPGLSFIQNTRCGVNCSCCPPAVQDPSCPPVANPNLARQISSENWLRGLVINMLMTDGRQLDNNCGYRPGSQGGHWSESYIENGPETVGTLMRTAPASGRIQENMNLISAYAKSTLDRLVDRGVALSVEVSAKYLGGARMQLDVIVTGRVEGETRVGINGARLENGWVWN